MGGSKIFTSLIFLFLSFTPFSYTASMKEIETIPVYYNYYWNEAIILLPTDLITSLDSLHLNEAKIPTKEAFETALERKLGSEASNFSTEARLVGEAHSLAETARSNAETQKLLIVGESLVIVAGGVTTVTGVPEVGVPTMVAGSILYGASSMNEARASLDKAFRALEKTATATNSAFDKLVLEAEKLEFAGAGYENYTGKASGTYNKLQSIISAYRYANYSNATRQELDAINSKYVRALALSKSIKRALESKNISSIGSSHSLPGALNALAGEEDGALLELAELYFETKSALSSMFEEYSELEASAEEKLLQLSAEKKLFENDDLLLLDSEITNAFSSSEWTTSASTPTQKLRELGSLLNGRGLQPSVAQALEKARDLRKRKPRDYLARAIEQLETARALSMQAETLAQQIDSDAESILSNAELAESKQRVETDLLLASFTPSNPAEQLVLEKASALREKCIPPAGTRGKQALQLYENVKIYSKIREMLSANYSTALEDSARSALSELEEATREAEDAGLDVEFEKQFVELAEAILQTASQETSESIREKAEQLLQQLEQRLESRTRELEAERERLLALLSKLDEEELSQAQLEEEYNALLEDDIASPSTLQLLEEKISSRSTLILSKHFSKTAQTLLSFDETPELDVETSATLLISLENDLPLSSEGKPLNVVIPTPFELPQTTRIHSKSSEILQFSLNSNKLILLLEQAEQGSTYFVSLKFSKKFAETISKTSLVLSLSEKELRKRMLVKFRSDSGLPRLRAFAQLQSIPSTCRALFNEREAQCSLTSIQGKPLLVELSSVEKGDGVFMLEYSIANPYSVRRTDIQVVQQGAKASIRFDASLKNNGEFLENIPVSLFEPLNSSLNISTFTVRGTCTNPKSVSAKTTEAGILLSFECPSLPANSSCTFPISFTVEDASAYARALSKDVRTALDSSPNAELERQLAQANSFITQGAYSDAIKLLLATREKTILMLAEYSPAQEAFLSQKASELAQEASAIPDLQTRAEVLELAQQANKSLNEDNFADASQKIAQAGALAAEYKKQPPELEAAARVRDALWLELNELKNKHAILASLTGNASLSQELLLKLESDFQQLNDLINSQDYSSASLLSSSLNSSIQNASTKLDSLASDFLASFISKKPLFESNSQEASALFEKFSKALEITVEMAKKNAFTPSFNAESLEKKFKNSSAHLQKTFKLAEANSQNPEIIFNNSKDFATALLELNELNETISLLQSDYSLFSTRAGNSVELGFLALKQLGELASTNAQFQAERERLSALMRQANESLEAGRLNDALVASSFVQDYAGKVLSSSPKQLQNSSQNFSELAILAVSAAFFLLLVFIFLKSKGKKSGETQKILEKIGKQA
ncbi:hypothetical protein HY992_02525 [Candidatus Micrarchaeota archaeon]|nr:hypothetical protein [Candidatus Micrarchaeota archaeon]